MPTPPPPSERGAYKLGNLFNYNLSLVKHIQWNFYSSFSSGVWKRYNGSGKTINAGAIVEIGFAQGP
jgi:hypothetical protein